MPRMTTWRLECEKCGLTAAVLCWDFELPVSCKEDSCGGFMFQENLKFDKAPGVVGDELIGYEAKHAVCHPDGTPRRFSSKTELKQALNEAGYNIHGDTPKPYNVKWSGKVKEPEKVDPIFKVKSSGASQ